MALIPGTTDMSVPESGEGPASGSAFSTTCYKSDDIINDIVKGYI